MSNGRNLSLICPYSLRGRFLTLLSLILSPFGSVLPLFLILCPLEGPKTFLVTAPEVSLVFYLFLGVPGVLGMEILDSLDTFPKYSTSGSGSLKGVGMLLYSGVFGWEGVDVVKFVPN